MINDDLGSWDNVLLNPTLMLTAEPVAFDKKDSWHKALTQSPDIVDARLQLESQKVRLKYTKNQLFPQLDLLGGYGVLGAESKFGMSLQDIEDQKLPNHYAGMRLNFPLNNRNARETHKQNKLEQERLLLSYKRIEQNLMRDIDISIRSAKTSFERVNAARKQHEFAAQALDAEEKKLANGKSTAFQVLQIQRDLTSSRPARSVHSPTTTRSCTDCPKRRAISSTNSALSWTSADRSQGCNHGNWSPLRDGSSGFETMKRFLQIGFVMASLIIASRGFRRRGPNPVRREVFVGQSRRGARVFHGFRRAVRGP